MRSLYLCGAGNSEGVRLAQVLSRRQNRWQQLKLLDDDPATLGRRLLGVAVIGGFEVLAEGSSGAAEVVNLVARTAQGRAAAKERIESFGVPFASLVAPQVDTAGVSLPEDVIVYQQAILGPEVTLGEGTVVFMGAVVGHECEVGPGCIVAANAVLNARVRLGPRVYVGANATVLPEVTVGADVIIGAGSVVVEDVPRAVTVMGVPGRVLAVEPAASTAEPSSLCRSLGVHDVEAVIRRAWEEVLQRSCIDPSANFFDVGGTSLLALKLRQRIERDTLTPVQLAELYRFPTIRSLAGHLGGSADGPVPATERRSVSHRATRRRRLHAAWHEVRQTLA